jgi:hypothetical protein
MQRLKMHPDLGGDHWNAALINEAFTTADGPGPPGQLRRDHEDAERSGSFAPAKVGRQPLPFTNGPRRVGRDTRSALLRRALSGHATRIAPTLCVRRLPESALPRAETSARRHRQARHRATKRIMAVQFESRGLSRRAFSGISEDVSINGNALTTPFDLPIEQADSPRVRLLRRGRPGPPLARSAHRQGPRWSIGVEFVTLRVKAAPGALLSRHA